MLALHDVTVRAGRATLLDGLSLHVAPGEVVAVVGANGAGKTTALRVLAGERRPDGGRATLGAGDAARDLGALAPDALARRRAVLPQRATLAFDFAVLDVVLLGRMPHAAGRAADHASAARAMERADVAHLAERRYGTLSGGEQQRVHLARALAQLDAPAHDVAGDARYLLLDEPTSALDLAHQHTVLEVARREAEAGAGVLAVLHDLNHAAQYADRVAVLAGGRLVACGPPREVLTPAVVRCAFGITVMVTDHPCLACPLVVPVGAGAAAEVELPLPVL